MYSPLLSDSSEPTLINLKLVACPQQRGSCLSQFLRGVRGGGGVIRPAPQQSSAVGGLQAPAAAFKCSWETSYFKYSPYFCAVVTAK